MANKIGKIIKTKNALHWDPYEPSQDKRHIQKKKKLNSQCSGSFLSLVTK